MYYFLIYMSTKTQSLIDLFVSYCIRNSLQDLKLLTNWFTGVWTHYTGTPQGTRTDHMVGFFQKDIDRISSLFYSSYYLH